MPPALFFAVLRTVTVYTMGAPLDTTFVLGFVDVEETGVELPCSQAGYQFLFREDLAGVLIAAQDFLLQSGLVIVSRRQFKRIDRVHAFGIKQRVRAAHAQAGFLRHLVPLFGAIS